MDESAPKPDPRLLVAFQRVCDVRNPDAKLDLTRGEFCTDCEAEVWVDAKMAHLLTPEARAHLMGVGTRIVCVECVKTYKAGTAATTRRFQERITGARRRNELN